MCFGSTPRRRAAYMRRRATSTSRTAPRAHGMTSVVRTWRMPSSWQNPIRSAFMPGRVGVGQLRDVADAHQDLDGRVARADLHVAVEGRREPEADRLDDRIDDVGPAERLEVGDAPVQGVELGRRVRDQDRRGPELTGHLQVLAVQAQHVVDAGPVGGEDLDGIEGVDAEGEPTAP